MSIQSPSKLDFRCPSLPPQTFPVGSYPDGCVNMSMNDFYVLLRQTLPLEVNQVSMLLAAVANRFPHSGNSSRTKEKRSNCPVFHKSSAERVLKKWKQKRVFIFLLPCGEAPGEFERCVGPTQLMILLVLVK